MRRAEEGQGGDPVRALVGLLAAWLAAWSLPSLALSGHGALGHGVLQGPSQTRHEGVCDGLGRLERTARPLYESLDVTPGGAPSVERFGSGVVTSYARDALDQPLRLTLAHVAGFTGFWDPSQHRLADWSALGAAFAVIEEHLYELFGTALGATGADYALEPLGWNGKPVDPRTEWPDHGVRWRGTPSAHWLSADPLVRGPDPELAVGEFWRVQPYGFVAGNPVALWTPDGRGALGEAVGVAKMAADKRLADLKEWSGPESVRTNEVVRLNCAYSDKYGDAADISGSYSVVRENGVPIAITGPSPISGETQFFDRTGTETGPPGALERSMLDPIDALTGAGAIKALAAGLLRAGGRGVAGLGRLFGRPDSKGIDDWVELSRMLRQTAAGQSNFGIGRGTADQADAMGKGLGRRRE